MRRRTHLHRIVGAVAVVVATVSLGALAVPTPASPAEAVRWGLAIDVVALCVASLAITLFAARARLGRQAADSWAVAALGLVALASVLAVTAHLETVLVGPLPLTWLALVTRAVGALGLGLAAWYPARTIDLPLRTILLVVVGGLALVAVLAVSMHATAGPLEMLPAESGASKLTLTVVQSLAAGGLLVAACGFFLQGIDRRHELRTWMGIGALAGSGGLALHVAGPGAALGPVHPGDVLRLAFHGALLVGILREALTHFRVSMEADLVGERRRLARDLHDGAAQEFAYVLAQCARLVRAGGGEEHLRLTGDISAAARRGLDGSRAGIALYRRPSDESPSASISRTAGELAARHDLELSTEIEPVVAADGRTQDALLRVTTEALTNAAIHGGARRVHVALEAGPPLQLRIADDGSGFDPSSVRTSFDGGFGLVSIRERVAELDGSVTITSRPGDGAVVEVVIPW